MNWLKKLIVKLLINHFVKKEGVKEMLSKIKDFLSGKKTYITAVIAILGAIVAWTSGDIKIAEAIKLIIAAITAMTMRAAVTKSAPPK